VHVDGQVVAVYRVGGSLLQLASDELRFKHAEKFGGRAG